tara:strand:- start:89 stop:292 length:204 start_codon:yes stop_codon:yes gene_type:complete
MSATRIKTDKGEGNINGMKTAEKKLEPNLQQGSANDKELASKYGDPNKITRGDIITAAIENQKKGMA